MKIVYACLVVGSLAACGKNDSGAEKGIQAMTTQGQGELKLLSKGQSLQEMKSSVVCEIDRAGGARVSLGRFYQSSRGLETTVPLTGLSVYVAGIKQRSVVSASEVYFNINDMFPSRPHCVVSLGGAASGGVSGRINCGDNVERAGVGILQITADFTCPLN